LDDRDFSYCPDCAGKDFDDEDVDDDDEIGEDEFLS